ncbi:MAG TPA: ParB N-terminal domain-containing protein [Polyangiaceae bacterium]|jgi:ParB-like chromosome segregation protein Spo0J
MTRASAQIEVPSAELPSGYLPDAHAVWMPISDAKLRRWAKNPRKNDGPPVDEVAASIRRFGFVAPICIWTSKDRMVAGHTRLKAMEKILAKEPNFVPKEAPGPGLVRVLFHEFDSEDEATAYALADNKLGELAQWDEKQLGEILADARARDVDMTTGTGFSKAEQDRLIDPERLPEEGDADSETLPSVWGVIVECATEQEQVMALEELSRQGYQVRALIGGG